MQVSPSQRTGPDSLPRAEWEDCSPTADARTDVQASHDGLAAEARRATAELVGAFALTFVAAGADVISRVSGNEVSNDARAIAPGLLVGAFIYAMGDVSGAHFNPAVTAAFALRGVFRLWRVPLYWVAQMLGAVGAALLLRQLFGDVASLGATQAHHGVSAALVMEIVLSWLLITVILGTATRHQLVGPNAAIAVGATIALCGLFALPISGASMNPARSLGPMIVAADLHDA
ncbi:MAG TPA: aquaporin, partial [Chloroflexota bacterium]|nr:aquaporin [Chloroflexota bacterium]